MSIASEIQSLSPSALIELFTLDYTNYEPGTGIRRFHAGTNKLTQPVVWKGNTYEPLPVEAEGFDVSTRGTLPRPKIRVANIGGIFSAEISQMYDLIGSIVMRERTFLKYLDAVNFPGGVNPTADPNQELSPDIWFVDQKVTENRYVIEWELSSIFDFQGVMLPRRQIIQNSCQWKYRGPECGYVGTNYFKSDDTPATIFSQDQCGKRLSSCQLRFGQINVLPFGAFPGANRYE